MTTDAGRERARLTTLLVLQIFLIFFQGFMIAPLVPRLALALHTSLTGAATLLPAYTLPYGCICLVVGPLADRHGRGRVLRWILLAAIALPALNATATSVGTLVVWRVLTGLAVGGVAPIALAMIAELYPYEERGRPVGWVFGAIAGGMAVGATCGPWLEPLIGWRGLFLFVSVASSAVGWPLWRHLGRRRSVVAAPMGARQVIATYLRLVSTRRGATAYLFVFLNGVFHAGVFSWLGVYFTSRYHLQPRELGFALLGYGIPGFLLGPVVGRLADRLGRRWLIRGGLVLAAACGLILSASLPVLAATCTVTALSFGFDLSHPLLAGLISALDPVHTAQAMAVNAFAIFMGFGAGSILFGAVYAAAGMSAALVGFGLFQLGLALASLTLFDRTWR